MSHYVCNGDCKSVSEEAGVCQADFCGNNGQVMTICGCDDGEHATQDTEEASNVTE